MKRGFLVLTSALTLITLSSCGVYNRYDKQTTVDDSLYGEAVAAVADSDSATFGELSWRELFTDPKLQSLIEQGLDNNTNLQSALLNIEASRAMLKAANLAFLPSLAIAPEGTVSGLISSDYKATQSYTIPLAASWEIDIFGRLRNDKLRTKMLFEQSVYLSQAIQTQVVSGVATLYYSLSMLDEQIAIAEATEVSWSESVRAAKVMMDAGMMNQVGLSQMEAQYIGVKSTLIDLVVARKSTENALCSLLALSPTAIETSSLRDVELPDDIVVGVPVSLLSARPDVMAAESALAASFYSTNMARSSFYPSLTLTGAAGWTNLLGSVVTNPAETVYSLVANAVQPIFTNGLNRAQLAAAKAGFESSRLAFQQTLLDAGIEVNDALTTYVSSEAKSQLFDMQVEQLRSAADNTQLLMTHGTTTYLEVLTSQQTLFSSEMQQVSNHFDQIQSMITLYRALGGGRF